MRPFTLLIGILLGSAASITFGLGAVMVIFFALSGHHPELAREYPHLLASFAAFGVLTACSAGSFRAQALARTWRGWAHAGTLIALAVLALMYWPGLLS